MLVIPMGRDQKDNAERVRTHHLGMAEDLERTSVKALVDLINHILSSERIKSGVAHMQSIFHERENNEADVAFIMNYVGPPEPAGVAERAAAR
jgi:UDP:flavonoid glycosyltransferase YjiC (YdhE family)